MADDAATSSQDLTGYCRLGPFHYDAATTHSKQENRLRDMLPYYTESKIRGLLLPIITQKDTLSLRVLDWLVTNYAKKHNIVYKYKVEGDTLMLNVYSEYKSWLRNYRRRNFDPFRRRSRIYFEIDRVQYQTTVGQLNFIYWSDVFGVLDYTRRNLQEIERDMNRSLSKMRQQKERDRRTGTKRKRRELSTAPRNKCFVYSSDVRLEFDSDDETTSNPAGEPAAAAAPPEMRAKKDCCVEQEAQ